MTGRTLRYKGVRTSDPFLLNWGNRQKTPPPRWRRSLLGRMGYEPTGPESILRAGLCHTPTLILIATFGRNLNPKNGGAAHFFSRGAGWSTLGFQSLVEDACCCAFAAIYGTWSVL